MSQFYWELEIYDGKSTEVIQVRPESAALIQSKIGRQEDINTSSRTVMYRNIKDFRISDKPYIEQKLLEDVAVAFNEPVFSDGSIVSRWVKKSVPARKYEAYYRFNPAYRKLREEDNHIVIAFRLPIHQINRQILQELTVSEVAYIEKY
jgi:hypothetical protein